MPRLCLELETDTSPTAEHSSNDEEEEAMLRALAAQGLEVDPATGETRETREGAAARAIICSCGYYTCPSVGVFGHPVPVFKEEIEPLFPQLIRDLRALELKTPKA